MMQQERDTESANRDSVSESSRANDALQRLLRGRESVLDAIPSIPTTVQSLLKELEQAPERIDLRRVADLIGRDESLTAQALRMANSPLLSRGQTADSILGAVRTLGITRTHDIALGCTIMRIGASQHALDPAIFWEHSLGCAILSRKLARSAGYKSPDKAYLAGLLHDIGYIANLVLAPQQMQSILARGSRERIFVGNAERAALGFTHCHSGELLANKWHFAPDIVEVIRCHHDPASAVVDPALVAIIALTDRMCRSSNLGLGYTESPDPAIAWHADWDVLTQYCPSATQMTWDDFVKDSDSYFVEIRELVRTIFSVPRA
jgi:HD-like signal output (HDOD) protein